ncbi:unnamed protein product [Schistosoma turkestanicum]|nr:unnamed protein product [Schistosoma turkestanicum]
MYSMTYKSRKYSQNNKQDVKSCNQLNKLRKTYSTLVLTDNHDNNHVDPMKHSKNHTTSSTYDDDDDDDDCTSKPIINTKQRRKYSFSQLLLRKAANISKKFKYYIIHSVALFNEDLYGLSWSEAHGILQSTYGISVETNAMNNEKIGRSMDCRQPRHFSTSVIPDVCHITDVAQSNTSSGSSSSNTETTILRKTSDIHPLQRHSRLYHLDKPYYIQCKKSVERNLTLINTTNTTNN